MERVFWITIFFATLGEVFKLRPLTQKPVVITISDQNEGELLKFEIMIIWLYQGNLTSDKSVTDMTTWWLES